MLLPQQKEIKKQKEERKEKKTLTIKEGIIYTRKRERTE